MLINHNIHALLSWAPANPAQTGRILAALDGAWERGHDLTVKLLVKYTTPHALARAEDIMDIWTSPTLKPRSAAHVSEILFLTDTVRVLRDEGKGYKIAEEHIAIVTLSPGTSEEPPQLSKLTWGDGGPERELPEGFIVEGIVTDVLRCKALWQTQSDLDIEDDLTRAPAHKPMQHWARLWIAYSGSAWEVFTKQHQLKSDIMRENLQVTIGHTSQISSKDSLVATVVGNTLWRYNPHTSGILWTSSTTVLLETAHPPETWSHILSEDAEREDKISAIRWKRSQEGGKIWCKPNTLTAQDRLKLGAKTTDDQSGAFPALLDIWLPAGGGLRQPQAEAQLLEMLNKITGTQWASAAQIGDVPTASWPAPTTVETGAADSRRSSPPPRSSSLQCRAWIAYPLRTALAFTALRSRSRKQGVQDMEGRETAQGRGPVPPLPGETWPLQKFDACNRLELLHREFAHSLYRFSRIGAHTGESLVHWHLDTHWLG
jgi:hypothetical protein